MAATQHGGQPIKPAAKYLSSKQAAKWIEEQKLIPLMLGKDSSHPELIKRTPPVMKFLAQNKALSKEALDLLWTAGIGKHEALVRVVYDALAEIASELPEAQLESLFARIKEIPLNQFTDILMNFLRVFTINALKGQPAKKADGWYGLDIYWRLIQDGVDLPSEFVELAHKILIDLLSRPQFESQRKVYVEKCMIGLRDDLSVVASLRLTKQIFDLYPTSHGQSVQVEKLISELDNKLTLLNLVVKDFLRYNQKVKSRAAGSGVAGSGSASNPVASASGAVGSGGASGGLQSVDPAFLGRHPHSKELSTRLEFLEYILTHAAFVLSTQHVDALWEVFVSNAVLPTDRPRLLKWLDKCVSEVDEKKQGFRPFGDDIVKYILTGLLSNPKKLDYSTLSSDGFRCFEVYLLQIATGEKLIARAPRSPSSISVLNFQKLQPLGIESLWQIATVARDPDVITNARRLLIQLFVKLDDHLNKKDIFKQFVSTSMNELSSHVKVLKLRAGGVEGGVVPSADVLTRTESLAKAHIELLESFLVACEKQDDAEEAALYPPKMRIEVWVRERDNKQASPSINVTLAPDSLIGVMRKELADYVKWPKERLKFVYKDKTLWAEAYDELTIREARIHAKGQMPPVLIVYKMAEADMLAGKPTDAAELKSDHVYPRHILANENQYFDLLFDLLNIGGELSTKVWRLMSKLPRNEILTRSILTFSLRAPAVPHANSTAGPNDAAPAPGGAATPASAASNANPSLTVPDWNRLLDPTSILKLLYSLQIVDANANAKDNDPEPRKLEVKEWCDVFLTQGGFQHLYNILMKVPVDTVFADQLPQQCLALTLKLLQHFLFGKFHAAAQIADSFMNYQLELQKLLEILLATVTSNVVVEASELVAYTNLQTTLVTYTFDLIVGCLLRQSALLQVLYGFTKWPDVFVAALLRGGPAQVKVREAVLAGIMKIVEKFDQQISVAEREKIGKMPRQFFLPQLLTCLPHVNEKASQCKEYFDLISALLKEKKAAEGKEDPNTAPTDKKVAAPAPAPTLAFDADQLASLLTAKIKSHPILEMRASDSDIVLRGIMNLTRELLGQVPALKVPIGKSLITDLYHSCLFEFPNAENARTCPPPKCKSPLSRKAAFLLLAELGKGCEANYREIMALVVKNHFASHSGGHFPGEWEFDSRAEDKSDTQFVGIKNLGCICYMNSLLQQMYMIPRLRRNLLAIEHKDNEANNDNFLYNIQSIMGHLQESEKQFANPFPFCQSFKDWDGKEINVNVQMDSQEFLNLLFDRIDTKLKGSKFSDSLKSVLGGKFSNEFICKGCPHYKEREEDFYAVSINVKNKKSLEESLRAFVTGELMEGANAYMCAPCGKKVDTLNRSCLKTLPPTIAFHLKRFEFDYNTMQKSKLNDRLEFPVRLSLRNYTKEGIYAKEREAAAAAAKAGAAAADSKNPGNKSPAPAAGKTIAPTTPKPADQKSATPNSDAKAMTQSQLEIIPFQSDEYYEYVLAGVLVHTGSADRGHYYSFVRERFVEDNEAGANTTSLNGGATAAAPAKGGALPRWFEFNDHRVTPFSFENLANETFGGTELVKPTATAATLSWGNQSNAAQAAANQPKEQDKYRNAYMVFYDRLKKEDLAEERRQRESKEKGADSSASAAAPAPVAAASSALDVKSAPGAAAATAATAASTAVVPSRPTQTRVPVPTKIFNQIWEQNRTHYRDRAIFDAEYFEFIWELVKAKDVVENRELIFPPREDDLNHGVVELTTRFIFETYSRSKLKKDKLHEWLFKLQKMYCLSVPSCVWLIDTLSQNPGWSLAFLLECTNIDVRKPIGLIIVQALETLLKATAGGFASGSSGAAPVAAASDSKSAPAAESVPLADAAKYLAIATKFIDSLMGLLKFAPEHWKKFEMYFRVLHAYASFSPATAAHLIKNHAIAKLIDFYMGDASPNPELNEIPLDPKTGKRKRMGDGWTPPEYTYFLGLLSCLVTNCATLGTAAKPSSGPAAAAGTTDAKAAAAAPARTSGVPWPDLDAKLIVLKPFLQRLLMEATSKKRARFVNDILCTLLTENMPLTEGVVGLVSLGIEEHHEDIGRCYFRILNGSLLPLKDSFAAKRLALTLSSLLNVMESQQQFWKITDFCIEHLIRLAKRYDQVYLWLHNNGNKLSWMLDWLLLHPNPPRMGEGMQMHKPNRHESLGSSYGPTGIATVKKKAALDAIKDGMQLEKLLEPETDGDLGDRTFIRLEWVDIKDTVNKWCLGQVVDLAEGRVLVHYDGWPSKWDEWLDVGSQRLATAGKYTTKDDWRRKKGWVDPNAKPVTAPPAAAAAATATAGAAAPTAGGSTPPTTTNTIAAPNAAPPQNAPAPAAASQVPQRANTPPLTPATK